jgi:hypothetical protein
MKKPLGGCGPGYSNCGTAVVAGAEFGAPACQHHDSESVCLHSSRGHRTECGPADPVTGFHLTRLAFPRGQFEPPIPESAVDTAIISRSFEFGELPIDLQIGNNPQLLPTVQHGHSATRWLRSVVTPGLSPTRQLLISQQMRWPGMEIDRLGKVPASRYVKIDECLVWHVRLAIKNAQLSGDGRVSGLRSIRGSFHLWGPGGWGGAGNREQGGESATQRAGGQVRGPSGMAGIRAGQVSR